MPKDILKEADNYLQALVSKTIPLPIAFNAWLLKNEKRSAFMIEQRELLKGSVSSVSKTITNFDKEFAALVYELSDFGGKIQKALIWRKNDKKATKLVESINKKLEKSSDQKAAEDTKKLLNIPCESSFYTGKESNMIIAFFIDPHKITEEDSSSEKRDPFMRQMCGNQYEILKALEQFNEFALISPYDMEFNVLKNSEYDKFEDEDYDDEEDYDDKEDYDDEEVDKKKKISHNKSSKSPPKKTIVKKNGKKKL